jgi:hypothetical protein
MLSPLEVTTAQTPTSCEKAAALALLTAAQGVTDAKTAWHWFHVYKALVTSAAHGGFAEDADGTYLLETGSDLSIADLASIGSRFESTSLSGTRGDRFRSTVRVLVADDTY